jgi:hypothetical protein
MVWTTIVLASLWVGGCNRCEQAHGDAVAAWDDVASFAKDIAAWWGKMEVEEGSKGHYGVPELAAKERETWRKAHRTALDTKTAVVTSGGGKRPPEVTKAIDELTNLEPPRPYEDWEAKLKVAKASVDQMVHVCPGSR